MKKEDINRWLGDDETLGREIKKSYLTLFGNIDELNLILLAALKLMIGFCVEANAEEYTGELKDVTLKGKPQGDWVAVIKRVKPPKEG